MASATIFIRFGLAALIMTVFCLRRWRRLRWLEIYQGAGLGICGGVGILFQMDGLAYTKASTSAFLTQSYCLLLPFIVGLREKRWPPVRVWLSCVMVLAGVAILGRVRFHDWKLGRGEFETLVGSLIFTGQILWLERPIFRTNGVAHFSTVMFFGTAAAVFPVALVHGRAFDWAVLCGSGRFWLLTALLIGPCTLVSFLTMNKWQPFVSATEAGLIYAIEPVWASIFALFLPALLSKMGRFTYENEMITSSLVVGGALITGANILIQAGPRPTDR